MIIKISDVEYYVMANKTRIENAIGERSIAEFEVVDRFYEYGFEKGEPVEIYDDEDELIYRGFINSVKSMPVTMDAVHEITAIDNHYLADKRRVAKAYEGEYAGNIVKDIITEVLADEGVTAGDIDDGPVITEAVFNYVSCSDAVSELAAKTGFWWKIDADRTLHFVEPTSVDAPFEVTPTKIIGKPSVTVGNDLYRNTQYVRGAKDITDLQTEIKIGDGANTTFTVGYPIAKVPTVKLNGNAQTVGIKGLEDGKDWYWNKGDAVLSQDPDGTVLESSDTLTIEYQGEYDIIIYTNDPGGILQKSEIENTSGIVEQSESQPNLTSVEAAFEAANKRLEQFSTENTTVKFVTAEKGLKAGQVLRFTHRKMVREKLLITETVAIRDGKRFIYGITAVKGHAYESWQNLFYRIAMRPEDLLIRKGIQEQEILVIVDNFAKTWTAAERPNIFYEVYAANDLYPSNNLYPMFEPGERVLYLAWYDGATEKGRKRATKTVTGADTLDTITYLAPYEANTAISHFGWIGGTTATADKNTGTITDKQAYGKTKTQLESLQINKTDTRDFAAMTGTMAITAAYMQGLDDLITLLEEATL